MRDQRIHWQGIAGNRGYTTGTNTLSNRVLRGQHTLNATLRTTKLSTNSS